MQNNNPNNYLQEDEIDLKEIFKFLINSKKLIIVTTLIITFLGAIYSFQKTPIYKTTALIEIGNYELDEYNQMAIEPAEALIKELTINFIHKQREGNLSKIQFNSIEDRLIQIASASPSSVQSEKLLNVIIGYIENRHSLLLSNYIQKTETELTYKIKNLNNQIKFINTKLYNQIEFTKSALLIRNKDEKFRISNEIESLDNQIEFTKSVLLIRNKDEKFRISNEIKRLNSTLPSLDTKIESLNKIINADKDNLLLLKSNPELFIQRAAQSPTLDQVIFSYNNKKIDYENEKIDLILEKNSLVSQLKRLEDNLESEDIFRLSQEKDRLEIQLQYLESNDSESDDIFKLSQEKDLLELELKILESNDLESDKIFSLSQEKDVFELELEFLMQQNPTSTQLIGEIVTISAGTKKELIIFLSFIFGLFLSIVTVLMNNSLKTFKEEQV